MKKVFFERAIFLSWYCARPHCKFCYMSTIRQNIKNPRLARRRNESVYAEALLASILNWRIEFISSGIHSHSVPELVEIVKNIHRITGQKQWLNLGVLPKEKLSMFLPHIKGVTGTVECINPKLHDEICPAKPLSEVVEQFSVCDELGLKKAITIIIGLGETEKDIQLLADFISKHRIDRVTFYRLVPHPGTPFKKGPETEYYSLWIRKTREAFPGLEIIAGSWPNKIHEIPCLLSAGADAITKFQSIKLFGTQAAREFKSLVEGAGFRFASNFTALPETDFRRELEKRGFFGEQNNRIAAKAEAYARRMRRNYERAMQT